MAAKAAAIVSAAEHSGFWTRFRRLTEDRVREVNAIAGEPLWEVVTPEESLGAFTIQSTRCPGDYLECQLDSETAILRCKPGSAIGSGPMKFRLAAGRLYGFGREGGQYTDYDAVTLILDKLAWIEEDAK